MTEPTTPDPGQSGDQGGEPTQQQAAFTPPATQADLDRIITERLNRQKSQFKDYDDLKAKAAELDKIKAANQTEAERQAQELTRWQSEAEKWRGTAVSSRIETIASADFADPSDAVSAIGDPSRFLDSGGQIDEQAIRTELAAVLDRKPHWRRQEGTPGPRVPAPNPSQGTGGQPATDPAAQFASLIQGQLRGS